MITDELNLTRRQMLAGLATASAAAALPGCASPAAVLDETQAHELARQAFLYAYPMAYFARLRRVRLSQPDPVAKATQRWNAFQHLNAVITPETPGAPQTDTFYSRLWHDVSREPLLISVPATDGRYWSLQNCDYLGTTFGMPNRRTVRGPTLVAIVGPNWRGALPAGVSQVYRSGMDKGFSLLRMYFAGPQDQAAAIRIQTGFQARPLSVHLAGAAWDGLDGSGVFQPLPVAADPLADFKAIQTLWQECPPPATDAALMRRFSPLGLAVGAGPIDALSAEVKRGMAKAEAEVRAQVVQATRSVPGTRTANGWVLPKPSIGLYADGDHLYRATCALFGTVCTPVDENVYVVAQHEAGFAKRLSGSARYELHFPKALLPQADAFWSVHAYTDRYTTIPHPAARYSVGDRTPGLVYGSDGSLTIHLQAEAPEAGRMSNWISTQAGQPFSLVVRAYEPQGAIKELSWPGPQIRVVG